MAQLGFIPRGGETFEFNGYRFSVVEMDGRRVARVKIQRLHEPSAQPAAPATSEPDTHSAFALAKRKTMEERH
jgi:putative hemolysin